VSASKKKGTAAETAVVEYLRASGFTQAERRTLNGAKDRGDIAGLPGVVIEVKNCARQELGAWVAEAELERDNDRASLGVVWHKRRGTTDPGRWFVTMSGDQFAALLREQQGLPTPTAEDVDAGLVPYLGEHGYPEGEEPTNVTQHRMRCGHDDYHDAHSWADQPHIWCQGFSFEDDTEGGAA
jgi:hypothetical protein